MPFHQKKNGLVGKNIVLFLAVVIVIARDDIIPRDHMKDMLHPRIPFTERGKTEEREEQE